MSRNYGDLISKLIRLAEKPLEENDEGEIEEIIAKCNEEIQEIKKEKLRLEAIENNISRHRSFLDASRRTQIIEKAPEPERKRKTIPRVEWVEVKYENSPSKSKVRRGMLLNSQHKNFVEFLKDCKLPCKRRINVWRMPEAVKVDTVLVATLSQGATEETVNINGDGVLLSRNMDMNEWFEKRVLEPISSSIETMVTGGGDDGDQKIVSAIGLELNISKAIEENQSVVKLEEN